MPIPQTKEEREDLIAELKQTLDNYLEQRAEQFSVKDKLSSADKTAREEFINDLKIKLDTFAESGNSEDVIQTLKNGITQFPGLNLQTTLHQITLRLIDDTPQGPIPVDLWTQRKMEAQDREYLQAIKKLVHTVYALEQFGDRLSNSDEKGIVKNLARQLSKDIDYLQFQHPDKVPGKEEFERFQTKFNARLHSQDVVMSKHEESWKPLVLNVVLAVVTLGIALGVKAIHSKVTEGRVSFFAAETQKQSKIKGLEQDLEDVAQKHNPGPGK